jgi:type I restriction enzyme S subunit
MGVSRIETKTGGRPASQGVIPGEFALSVGKPDKPTPQGWSWTALTDVARLESGHTPSRKHPEYWGGDVPWIGIKDATENHGRVLEDTLQHTNKLGIAKSSARVLPPNTVCLSRTASVGYVVVMGRPMATSQDFVNWVCSDAIDYRYLKYVLLSERAAFMRFASGTTHQTIYFPEVKAFHVCLPPLSEQHAIAHILGMLDDKIELNRRRNQTLEAMARALFKDWFVDFGAVRAKLEGREPYLPPDLWHHFPDRLDDDGGKPEEWKFEPLSNFIDIFDSRRVPLSGKQRAERKGLYPYHGATGVMDRIDEFLFDGVYVLLGEDGSVVRADGRPYTQYVWGKFWVNNHAHVLRGRGISNETLLIFLDQCDVAPFVTGAVQPKLSQRNLKSIPFLNAGRELMSKFGDIVEPLFRKIRCVNEESRTLTQLRDTLLPKLISGELRVEGAKRIIEGAA